MIENVFNFNLAAKFDDLDLPTGIEATVPWLKNSAAEEPSKNKQTLVLEDEIDTKYRLFKQFDTVRDHSDHHFTRPGHLKIAPTVKKVSEIVWFYHHLCVFFKICSSRSLDNLS